ncbi:MAG TPA: hypothetical protein VFA64_10980 [Hyphomicrobiaceae bacterium]|nr:hypothetical protein [Hyphomicrobiaceae bacterium]
MSAPLHPLRPAISCLTAAALVLAQIPALRAASAMTRAEYEACQARDENGFRSAIELLTRKGLEAGLSGVDYKAMLAEEWRRGNVDDIIDREVDRAIGEVREESSWFKLWSSLASREKAQELATTAAERVYRSEPVKKAIEQLAAGIGKDIGKRIELATIDSAAPATQCIQAFLGARYGATIARVVADGAGREYTVDPTRAGAQVSTGQVLIEGREGIAGTVVLVVRRQLANMAARIGQRIVGSILSKLVSVVASGVGLVLIAKDIWDFRHGVLPIVAGEMKSKETKEKVREELARSIAEHIDDSLAEIAQKTAERVVEIWQEFRRAHAKVLELAERKEAFRNFLDTVKAADMPRLDEVVALVLAGEGEEGVMRRLADGTLHRAVTALPAGAIDIAREAQSLETALKWQAIAGDSLPKVVDYELHRRASPDSFTKASLQRLIGLEDRLAITRLAALKPEARAPLFEIETGELRMLGRALDEGQLDSLARYLTGLEKGPALRLLRAVAQTPTRMAELGKPRVREAIIASSDQAAAVGMMLQASSLPDPAAMLEHLNLVVDGRVSPWLIWEKHPATLAGTAVLALALLLMLKRLLFGTRAKIVVRERAGFMGRGGRR